MIRVRRIVGRRQRKHGAASLHEPRLDLGISWTATANRAICELVRLAARLIIEEGLEGEATDALGQGYYARGAARKRTWLADL
jgi:hypothetical protein